MKPIARLVLPLVASVAALGLVPAALAHGGDMEVGAPMEQGNTTLPEVDLPPTYFAYPEHQGVIYAHISLMVLAWVFILPVGVMFSLTRSRFTLVSQLGFLVVNGLGLLLGVIYNRSTPDLYPNNAHHKLGWIVTWVLSAQAVMGLLAQVSGAFAGKMSRLGSADERGSFIPVSTEAMKEHESRFPKSSRSSNDSGQGTEPNTESLRGDSISSGSGTASPPMSPRHANKEYLDDEEDEEDIESHLPSALRSGASSSVLKKIAGKISLRVWKAFMFGYNFVDRTVLILGFIALCTGVVTFGRFFEGGQIFTGLAHWIKGGVFFWLGVLTLGRWAGSFADMGWAWNIRPKRTGEKWRPSAEFVESALIFFYGSTNIFLEHLGNAGKAFSSEDLEHISITVLFLGGGLCGMLVESTWIRDLLNTTVLDFAQKIPEHEHADGAERDARSQPRTYRFSMNPIPALVIMLLGMMMGSHTQTSMVSSMVHKQWGNLLSLAATMRGLTYVLMFLVPPKSIYPSRPPTELITSFCLIAGGIIFMVSSGDTIEGMIHYDIDAMFVFTVTMGFVGLIMAWIILVIALKGWAVRKEARGRRAFRS